MSIEDFDFLAETPSAKKTTIMDNEPKQGNGGDDCSKRLEEQKNKYEHKLNEMVKDRLSILNELKQLKIDYEKLEEDHLADFDKYNKEISDLTARLSKANDALYHSEENYKAYEEKYKAYEMEAVHMLNQRDERINDLKESYDRVKKEVDGLYNENSDLAHNVKALKATLEVKEQELTRLKAIEKELQDKFDNELKELQEKLLKELEEMKSVHDNELESLKTAQGNTLEELKVKHSAEVQEIIVSSKQEKDDAIAKMQAQYEKELEDQKIEAEQDKAMSLTALEEKYKDEMTAARVLYDKSKLIMEENGRLKEQLDGREGLRAIELKLNETKATIENSVGNKEETNESLKVLAEQNALVMDKLNSVEGTLDSILAGQNKQNETEKRIKQYRDLKVFNSENYLVNQLESMKRELERVRNENRYLKADMSFISQQLGKDLTRVSTSKYTDLTSELYMKDNLPQHMVTQLNDVLGKAKDVHDAMNRFQSTVDYDVELSKKFAKKLVNSEYNATLYLYSFKDRFLASLPVALVNELHKEGAIQVLQETEQGGKFGGINIVQSLSTDKVAGTLMRIKANPFVLGESLQNINLDEIIDEVRQLSREHDNKEYYKAGNEAGFTRVLLDTILADNENNVRTSMFVLRELAFNLGSRGQSKDEGYISDKMHEYYTAYISDGKEQNFKPFQELSKVLNFPEYAETIEILKDSSLVRGENLEGTGLTFVVRVAFEVGGEEAGKFAFNSYLVDLQGVGSVKAVYETVLAQAMNALTVAEQNNLDMNADYESITKGYYVGICAMTLQG